MPYCGLSISTFNDASIVRARIMRWCAGDGGGNDPLATKNSVSLPCGDPAPSAAAIGNEQAKRDVLFEYAVACARRGLVVVYMCSKKYFHRYPPKKLRRSFEGVLSEDEENRSPSLLPESLRNVKMKYVSHFEEIRTYGLGVHLLDSPPDILVVDDFCTYFATVAAASSGRTVRDTVALLHHAALFLRDRNASKGTSTDHPYTLLVGATSASNAPRSSPQKVPDAALAALCERALQKVTSQCFAV